MIRINLLPFRAARKKENIKRQLSIFLLSLALVLIAIYYFNSTLKTRIVSLDEKIAFTQKEINRFKQITKEIAKIQKELDILNKKIAVINGLEQNRMEPIQLLEAMTQVVIAKRMWFTSFAFRDTTVQTNGIALDEKTVADFMTRLQQSNLFSSVNLLGLRRRILNNVSLRQFEISSEKKPFELAAGSAEKK